MAKKLSVPGILAVPQKFNYKDSQQIGFNFKIAQDSPANPMFFTSPSLRNAIKSLRSDITGNHTLELSYLGFLSGDEPIGFIRYERKKSGSNPVYEEFIFPFHRFQKTPYLKAFEGNGIALGLEKIVQRQAQALLKNGKMVVVPAESVSNKRRDRVLARGISVINAEKGPQYRFYKFSAGKNLELISMQQRKFRKKKHLQNPQARLDFAKAQGMKLRTRRR